MGKIDFGDNPFIPRIDDDILNGLGSGETETSYDSDYSVRLATLAAMGGDTSKEYDSVYAIDLEILKLTEEGGVSGSAIKDVSVLPDAEENKNKMYRLTSDEKIYVAEAVITTSEEIAPDSEQVGVAYITDDGNEKYYYDGVECYLSGYEEEYYGYRWTNENNPNSWIFTVNKAEDITTTDFSEIEYYLPEHNRWYKDGSKENGYYADDITIETLDYIPATAIHIEKQTVTEETWGWKPLGQSIQSITYDELKSLRDNSQLVAGQKYRITDYVTTTAQSGTTSAGHPFDIIVTADDVNKLNENARAINHTNIVAAIQFEHDDEYYVYVRYPEGDEDDIYAWASTDATDFNDTNISNIDTDNLIYTDTETVSVGDTYDFYDEGEDNCEITDYSDSVDSDYFANSKLASWELKYCLDNDTNRFSWAQVGQEGLGFAAFQTSDLEFYKRYPDGDDDYGYAWVLINNHMEEIDINSTEIDWTDIDTQHLKQTDLPYVEIGEEVGEATTVIQYSSDVQYVPDGKGVIYYMKDEWNNQVYFDFKNIKFYNEDVDIYFWLFGDDDCSLWGAANNNTVDSKVEDAEVLSTYGKLTLPTYPLGYAVVGYDSKFPTIEGTANLLYDNSFNITGVTDVQFYSGCFTEDELMKLNDARVRMNFDVNYGGVIISSMSVNGFLNKFVASAQGQDVPVLLCTFSFLDLQAQTYKTLYLEYDTKATTPSWKVQL